jgi:hypothetical protein
MSSVTNAELKAILEGEVMPAVQENKRGVDEARQRIEAIEPKVNNHEIILYGDPKDRKDEGVIGVLNNIDEKITAFFAWVKPVALSIITAMLLWAGNTLFEMYIQYQLLMK